MWMWNYFFNSMDCIIEPVNNVGGVYVGSISAAENLPELKQKSIRAVLCVAANVRISYNSHEIDSHKVIPAEDIETFDLEKYFDEGIKFIEENSKKTNVLIHCFAGVSRSGAMVIAYLMKTKKLGFQDALKLAQEKRSVITPNEGFKTQLKKYETNLEIEK